MENTFRSQKTRSRITIYHIIYRPKAKKDLEKVRHYLQRYYKSTPIKFNENLNSKLELLKVCPEMYQFSKNNSSQRRIPLMYGYYLTYTIKNNFIYIKEILNSRKSQ